MKEHKKLTIYLTNNTCLEFTEVGFLYDVSYTEKMVIIKSIKGYMDETYKIPKTSILYELEETYKNALED